MSNPIVKALEHAAEKLGKTLGKDAGKAVQDMYHGAGHRLKKVATNHAENDAKHAAELDKLFKGGKEDIPHAPHATGGGRPGGGDKPSNVRPGSMNGSTSDPHLTGRPTGDRPCENDPVDVASGELLQTETDLDLPGVLPLRISRTHLSSYRYGQFFGPSWASALDERLEVAEDGVVWAREDGSLLRYESLPTAGSGGASYPVTGAWLPLVHAGTGALGETTYEITDRRTGIVRVFADSPSRSGWFWLQCVVDRNGNEIALSRLEDGTPTTVHHSGGYVVRIHTEAGRVSYLALDTSDGPAEIKSYRYDHGSGNVTHVVNSSGKALEFGYDSFGRMTSWTDRNGSTFRYEYDQWHRVVRTIGPDGVLSSRFAYDRAQRTTRYVNSQGAVTVYRFNAQHQVIAETDPLGNTVRREWDEHGNLLAETDPLGHTTHYAYDDAQNLTAVHRPDSTTVRAVYNGLNLPVEITTPDGSVWRQAFDEGGNLTEHTAPDGTVTRYGYDLTGAVAEIIAADGSRSSYANNGVGLPTSYTDPLGHTAHVERDTFGRPVALTDPLGVRTHLEWTREGKIATRTGADGARETWEWDGEGNLRRHTDQVGGVSAYAYTHFDKLVSRTTPDGATYCFTYDTELRLTQVTDPAGLTWDYTFDEAGRRTAESDFDNRTSTYGHDAAGRLATRITPTGDSVTYERDSLGRITSKEAAGYVTRYRHDPQGRLLEAVTATSRVAYERDVRGRVLAETVDGRTVRHTYDELGRRTSRTTPTGAVTHYAYDAAGRTTGVDIGSHALAFTHDAAGRETTRTFGTPDAPVSVTSVWDVSGRLVARAAAAPGRTLTSRTYRYRPDGHLTAITDERLGTGREFTLDPIGRPLGVSAENWIERYSYDLAGNQTEAAWPDQAGHDEARGPRTYAGTRLEFAGRVRYEYDAAGRITLRQKKRLSAKPDTWRYAWDAEDRLTACTTPDGTHWAYTYDALGRRASKSRLTADGQSPAETVAFTWDGTRLAEEHSSTTGVTTTWDHKGHTPLAQYERKHLSQDEVDTRFFAIATDLTGMPTELISEDGDLAWQARTTTWGSTAWNRNATAYTPLRYPGQYADRETELHYNFFRHYDPDTGRYASPDPLGLGPAANPVSYVLNPSRWRDPLGLFGCEDDDEFSSHHEPARDLSRYTEGQSTRDPSSQWYHEYLSNDELVASFNNAGPGDGFLVSPGGQVLGGHHRWDELMTRVGDGRIDPETPIRVDVLGGE
ncbi:DUF6531 domain-containing protein [Streptomyces lydicus]|uniref:DUF6531 domain-containing protein n=1 Tax=Streptomyces lydicus TaxID=47763 RepID=UPI001012721F|nr:DUF6531 domain-containing protein [Streptomyces lydicus]MCZ1007670.1 DUF6531 domain-containing protein [Streptomyces lydicus]